MAPRPQPLLLGRIRVFVAPNPGPVNAYFTAERPVNWHYRLAAYPQTTS